MHVGVNRTPHTSKNSPSVNDRTVGDSTWMIPLVSCVWRGENTTCGLVMIPICAGTTCFVPFTYRSRCWWMWSSVPSADSAGRPSADSRASRSAVLAGHGAGPFRMPGSVVGSTEGAPETSTGAGLGGTGPSEEQDASRHPEHREDDHHPS